MNLKRAFIATLFAGTLLAVPGTALAGDVCPNGTVNSTEDGIAGGTELNGELHSTTNTVC